MKIVVASDSMKGSLTSAQVAEAIANGIRSTIPEADVAKVAIADGGEGTADALVSALNGRWMATTVHGPLGDTITAHYGIIGNTAVIEMAQAAGLCLIPQSRRNPMLATTYGVGEMVISALDHHCRHILMCIGGSATNDGGMGMLSALGAHFLDRQGMELDGTGQSLSAVGSIDLTHLDKRLYDCVLDVACDVANPLYGPTGAAHVFARQKGADDHMIEELDTGLRNYGALIDALTGKDISAAPGAGAAGGMGAGLLAIPGARLRPGIDIVLDAVNFDEIISDADLIITGEGHIDRQTLGGKAPVGVLRRGQRAGVPVVAIAGLVDDNDALLQAGFAAIQQISDPSLTLAENMRADIAAANICRHIPQLIARFHAR